MQGLQLNAFVIFCCGASGRFAKLENFGFNFCLDTEAIRLTGSVYSHDA